MSDNVINAPEASIVPGVVGSATTEDLGETLETMIRQRISHTLGVYPKLSPSMLQVGIGTGISPSLWHVVLDKMVAEGIVSRHQQRAVNPVTKRDQTYTVLSLTT